MWTKSSVLGLIGVAGICLSVADASAQMGAQVTKKPGAAPAPSPSSAVLPVAYFKPSTVDKPETASYNAQPQATLRCPAAYQLRTTTITNNPSVGPAPRGFCERTETEIESKRPGCPSGWGYLIPDDQLVPAVKAKFGKADQCFNSSKKKEDVASYVAPNCIIGPNGVTGGFVLVVKDGADACERPREVQKNASLTGGSPIAVNQITPDMFVKSITAGCPGGSSLYVDLGDRSIAAVPSSSWPANAGAFCKRN